MKTSTCRAIVALALSVALTTPARGDWPSSGLPLATGSTQQFSPLGLAGPDGGLHAFWADGGPSSHALYAQHVTPQGTVAPGWPAGGRGIVATPAAILAPRVAPDGSGGAILAWYDFRVSGGPRGIYGVRVGAEGEIGPGWSATGTPVCTTANPQGLGPLADLVAVCGDGAGGAYVAWTDARNTPPASTLVYDVFAQHVLADGSLDPGWPAGGRGLTTGPGYKYPHALIADGAGGFWLATEASNATWRFSATHHDADGAETGAWTSPSYASRVTGVSDGAGGIFLAWRDCRDCPGESDAIYAIRLGPDAGPRTGWPAGGVAVAASAHDENVPVIVATGDGAALVAWLEDGPGDAYVARRVEGDGTFASAWQGGGRAFATSTGILAGQPLVAPDGEGGAMFAFRRNLPNLFGSRLDAAARVPAAFPDTGLSLCTVSGDQFPVALVADGRNGAYLLWEDGRDYGVNRSDVYAIRFTREGDVGSASVVEPPGTPGLALSAPRPNPTSSSATLGLTLSAAAAARVEVLDPMGRRIAVLHDGALGAGTHVLRWDGRARDRSRLPPGVYLVRARTPGATATRRIAFMP